MQLPLGKGDALFLSPALFHAAGENRTKDFERVANLMQTSAAFGKPMESIDRVEMAKRVYPVLLCGLSDNTLSQDRLNACVASVADSYAFPTNLDVVVPLGGNSPETAQQLMLRALAERWPAEQFNQALLQQTQDRQA